MKNNNFDSQTIIKSVAIGYIIGLLLGIMVGITQIKFNTSEAILQNLIFIVLTTLIFFIFYNKIKKINKDFLDEKKKLDDDRSKQTSELMKTISKCIPKSGNSNL